MNQHTNIFTILFTCSMFSLTSVSLAEVISVSPGNDTIQKSVRKARDGDIVQLEPGEYVLTSSIDVQGKALTIRGSVDEQGRPNSILSNHPSDFSGDALLQCHGGETRATVFDSLMFSAPHMGTRIANVTNSEPVFRNCQSDLWVTHGENKFSFRNSRVLLDGCRFNRSVDIDFTNQNSFIVSRGGALEMQNCHFGADADWGIYTTEGCIKTINCQLMLSDCSFQNCLNLGNRRTTSRGIPDDASDFSSRRGCGGALNLGRGASVIRNSVFRQNEAESGGAIYAGYGSDVRITGCHFDHNGNSGYATSQQLYLEGERASVTSSSFVGNNHGSSTYTKGRGFSLINCHHDGDIHSVPMTNRLGTWLFPEPQSIRIDDSRIQGDLIRLYGNHENLLIELTDTEWCGDFSQSQQCNWNNLGGNTAGNCRQPFDLNRDGVVDGFDLGQFLNEHFGNERPDADFNRDGMTDAADFGLLMSNWHAYD